MPTPKRFRTIFTLSRSISCFTISLESIKLSASRQLCKRGLRIMFGLLRTLLACSILLGSAIASYGQTSTTPIESPKKYAASGEETTKQPKRDAKQAPPAVEMAPASESNQKPSKSPNKTTAHPTPDWWLIGITGLLAIATSGLVFYARDTARRQLRAYISIVSIKQTHNTINPDLPAYEIKMRNSGQTPAYAIKTWRGIGMAQKPLLNKLAPPPEAVADTDVILGIGAEQLIRRREEKPD